MLLSYDQIIYFLYLFLQAKFFINVLAEPAEVVSHGFLWRDLSFFVWCPFSSIRTLALYSPQAFGHPWLLD